MERYIMHEGQYYRADVGVGWTTRHEDGEEISARSFAALKRRGQLTAVTRDEYARAGTVRVRQRNVYGSPDDEARSDGLLGEFVGGCYMIGFFITAFITFISSWIYCIDTYGFLLGVGLGWFPSFIVAMIVGVLWPLLALVVVVLLVLN